MKFVNWFVDTIYDFFEYLIMLLVVLVAVVIIFWRLNGLFNAEIPLLSTPGKVIESTISSTKQSISEILGQTSLEGESITFKLPEGTDIKGVANILFEYELIKDKDAFIKYAEDNGYTEKIVKGKHTLKIGSSDEEIMIELIKTE